MTEPEISVVVPTYQRPDRIERLLGALERQTLDPARFEVVVVDNGSDAPTGEVLARVGATTAMQLRPLRIEDNHGPAPARNLGWRSARAALVAFTDDDCVPHPDWLERALATARSTPDLGVLQGATHPPPGSLDTVTPNTLFRETLAPSLYFEGCNLVFPRWVLERTGGFDERYHFGGEDTEAGWAAAELGRWVFEPTAIVEHDVEERPWRWHLMMAWREGVFVDVAARHPAMREAFWRPWAHRKWNAAFALGFVATLVGLRYPLALLGWVPWLRLRCPSLRHPRFAARTVGHHFVNDLVAEAGMVKGSVRNRTLVL